MALNTRGIITAAKNEALKSGLIDSVNGHEPVSPPGNGQTAAVWVDQLGPAARASGLAATSARLALTVRLYMKAWSEPRDAIDPDMMDAVDFLMGAYTGGFTFGGLVKNVDILGAHGIPLQARAGYVTIKGHGGEAVDYRVYTITVPLVINDVWEQSP